MVLCIPTLLGSRALVGLLPGSRQMVVESFVEIYSYSNLLLSPAKCSAVSMAWSIPCGSEGGVTLLSVT